MHEMSTTEKVANLGAVVIPFLATLAAILLLWNRLVGATDLVIAAVMYLSPRSASRSASTAC